MAIIAVTVSFEKIATHLPDFHCRRDVALGARELHAIFERIGDVTRHLRVSAYTRLKQIQHLRATSQIDEHFFWQ